MTFSERYAVSVSLKYLGFMGRVWFADFRVL